MAELDALGYFFRTLDTELERIIEAEDVLTRASDPLIPSHEQWLAASDASLPDDGLDELYADQYWEELSAKFRPHFYAAVTLLVVAVLEAALTRLSRFLRIKNRLPVSPGQIKGSTLEQFRVFANLSGWKLPPDDVWGWAADLYEIRNALVHEAGSLYALSEEELDKRTRELEAVAKRRGGLEVERVHEPMPLLEELPSYEELASYMEETKKSGKRKRKLKTVPLPIEGVTIAIQREFCANALEKTRVIVTQLYAPLLKEPRRTSRGRSRRRRRE